MKEFFLILFFAKSVLLTPEPIDISGGVRLTFPEPVSAITSGAHIRIDVTRSLTEDVDLSSIVAVLDHLNTIYPDGSVTGTLTTAVGQRVILDLCNGSANGKNAELLLSSSSGVPTGIEYSQFEIRSSIDLHGVKVTWQNHQE